MTGRAGARRIDVANPIDREWRRLRRRGVPARIDRDPALRSWLEKNGADFSFQDLATLARGVFGPERAPGKSVIARWFKQNEARLLGATDAPEGPFTGPGGPVHSRAGECLWCRGPTQAAAHRPTKRFCGDPCRNAFHSAARRWCVVEAAAGRLDVAALRKHTSEEES